MKKHTFTVDVIWKDGTLTTYESIALAAIIRLIKRVEIDKVLITVHHIDYV